MKSVRFLRAFSHRRNRAYWTHLIKTANRKQHYVDDFAEMQLPRVRKYRFAAGMIFLSIVTLLMGFSRLIGQIDYQFNSNQCKTFDIRSHVSNRDSFDAIWDRYRNHYNCISENGIAIRDVVRFKASGDLSSRITTITSAVFMAMMAGEFIIIDWAGDGYDNFEDLFQTSPLYGLFDHSAKEGAMVDLDEDRRFQDELLCSDDMWTVFRSKINGEYVQWITFSTYFAAILKRSPMIRSWLEETAADGQIFSRLARRLFQPSEQVIDLVAEFVSRNPSYESSFNRRFGREFIMKATEEENLNIAMMQDTFNGSYITETKCLVGLQAQILKAYGDLRLLKNKKRLTYSFLAPGLNVQTNRYLSKVLPNIADYKLCLRIHMRPTTRDVISGFGEQLDSHPMKCEEQAGSLETRKVCIKYKLAKLIIVSLSDYVLYPLDSKLYPVVDAWRQVEMRIPERIISAPRASHDYYKSYVSQLTWLRTVVTTSEITNVLEGAVNRMSVALGREIKQEDWFLMPDVCSAVSSTEPKFEFGFNSSRCGRVTDLSLTPGERIV